MDRFEDFEAGRYRSSVPPEAVPVMQERAQEKRARILAAAEQVLLQHPHMEPQVERIYMLLGEFVETR